MPSLNAASQSQPPALVIAKHKTAYYLNTGVSNPGWHMTLHSLNINQGGKKYLNFWTLQD